MRKLDGRRRLGAIAVGLTAVAAGLALLSGRHGSEAIHRRFFLSGVSVGILVGVVVILVVKAIASRKN